jgi:hypothetical protein
MNAALVRPGQTLPTPDARERTRWCSSAVGSGQGGSRRNLQMAQGGLLLDPRRQVLGDFSFIFEADTFYGDWEMGRRPAGATTPRPHRPRAR